MVMDSLFGSVTDWAASQQSQPEQPPTPDPLSPPAYQYNGDTGDIPYDPSAAMQTYNRAEDQYRWNNSFDQPPQSPPMYEGPNGPRPAENLREQLPAGFEDYSGIRRGTEAFGGQVGALAGGAAGSVLDRFPGAAPVQQATGLPSFQDIGQTAGTILGSSTAGLLTPRDPLEAGLSLLAVPGAPSLAAEAGGALARGGAEFLGNAGRALLPEVNLTDRSFFGGIPTPNPHDLGRQTIRELGYGDVGGRPLADPLVPPKSAPTDPFEGLTSNYRSEADRLAAYNERYPAPGFGSAPNMANMGHPIGVEPTLPSTFRPPEVPPSGVAETAPAAQVNAGLESKLGEMASNRISGLLPESASGVRNPIEGTVLGEGFKMNPSEWDGLPRWGQDTGVPNGPNLPPRGLRGGSYESGGLPPLSDSTPEGARATLLDYLNLPRSLMAGADMSYALRQMGLLAPSYLPEFIGSLGRGARAALDPEYAALIEKQIAESSYAALKQTLYQAPTGNTGTLLSREENYAAMPALETLGPIGRAVRAIYEPFERGNTTMINKFRSDISDNFITTAMRNNGITDPAQVTGKLASDIDRYNNFITRATGRGTLGDLEKAAIPLSQIFFSARSAIAKPQSLGYLLSQPGSPVWNQVAKDFAGFLGTGVATLALADQAGLKVGMDPRSSTFGKIMVGDNHIDIWGGWQQMARAVYQEAQSARGENNAITAGGREYSRPALQVAADFLRNKASPPVGAALDMAFPNGYRDAPGFNMKTAVNYLAPLWIQDTAQALMHDGLQGALISGPSSFLGVGNQTYGAAPQTPVGAANTAVKSAVTQATTDPETLSRAFPKNPEVATALNGVKWEDLEPQERTALKAVIDPKLVDTLESEKQKLGGVIYDTGKKLDEVETRIDSRKQEWGQALSLLSDKLEKGQGDPIALRQSITQLRAEGKKDMGTLYAEQTKIKADPAYKDALAKLPPQPKQQLDDYLTDYRSIKDLPSVHRTDGSTDYKKVDAIQQAYLGELKKTDPNAATRIGFIEQRTDPRSPMEQFIDDVVRPVANVYFTQPEGTKTQWLRDHPNEEATLWAGGYIPTVHSPQAQHYGTLLMPSRPPAEVRR